MTGGIEVRTATQAREVAMVIGGERPVKEGDHVKIEPCLSPQQLADPKQPWQLSGRRCPRVDLPSHLESAANAAFMLISDSPQLGAFLSLYPRRIARQIYRRAEDAAGSPQVTRVMKACREAMKVAAQSKGGR